MRREFAFLIFLSPLFAAPPPVVTSIPYFGDKGSSPIQSIALDTAGNIYIAGTTTAEIPLVNALQPKLGGGNCDMEPWKLFSPCPNIFVAKFDPTGTKLIYSTYLGGDQRDFAAGLAVDRDGNAYIAGTTRPPSPYPVRPYDPGNAFVKKLSPDGSALLYTRYIGGVTTARGIAVDATGNAYISGYSFGADLPTVHPLPVQPAVKALYVTSDGGGTWHVISGMSGIDIDSLAIDPTRPSTLYAATSGGLYKSADAGANWTHLLPAAAVGSSIVVDPRRPSAVYATYTTGSGMYIARSTDAGATWTTISDNFPLPGSPSPMEPIGAFAIDPSDSNVLWAIVNWSQGSTVIKSTDSGDHWQLVATFPRDNLHGATLKGLKLLIDPNNGQRLFACCVDYKGLGASGIYRTDDGGKTWVQGAPGQFTGSAGILSPWLDPRDSSVLYGNWWYGLERSTDGGMTWDEFRLSDFSGGFEPGSLAVDGAGTLYLVNDGGFMLRIPDLFYSSWMRVEGPWAPLASILAIDPTNPSTLYVASSGASFGMGALPARHAFAAKLDASGVTQWATLLGGSGQDEAHAVALDSAGNAYITGNTNSDDFPTVNAFQAVRGKNRFPTTNAFVTKISADGSKILYSSFLGGTGIDSGNAIAVDAAGNAYVAGGTQYGVFPVIAPLQPQPDNPNASAFVAKVDATGGKLVYSTLLAGSGGYPTADQASTIAVDPQGRAVVAGFTGDFAFPLVNPIQPTLGSGSSFIARFAPSGGSLDFSTYLDEGINALALARNGAFWITGSSGPVRIDFQPSPAQPGVPLVRALYNSASYIPGEVVAPGEIVTLIGEELAPAAQSAGPGSLPRMMQGVSVSLRGLAAPLFYVSPTQINFQAPVELALGSAALVVQRGTQVSAVRTVRIVASAPGLFAAGSDVRGTPLVVHANDFSLVTEQNPAHPGEYLAAFCTGLGATEPAATSGEPATSAAPLKTYVFAQLGSEAVTPVSYAGLVPGWVGLYQINFRLRENEAPGRKQLSFEIQFYPTNQAPIWVQ